MNSRTSLGYLLSTAIALGSAQAAAANDAASALGGFIVGTIVGNAVSNAQPRKVYVQEKTVVYRAPAVNNYQREQNRQVQTSLNYFGFPAGVPDGVMGRNSRAAAAQYQAFMGYPPTGYLSDYEQAFLTSSYNRALVGGPQTSQVIAASGQGVRGLLLAYRQEQTGGAIAAPQLVVAPAPVVAPPAPVAPTVVAAPVIVEAAAPAPEPEPAIAAPVAAALVEPAPAASALGDIPNFLPGQADQSMASQCNRTNLATNTNGGFVKVGEKMDPSQALAEQFCLARTYAIEQGESLAATVQGFTMAEMQAKCEAFAPSMREYQARLATQSPAEASAAFQEFVVGTGAQPAQLSGNARICLGIGYRLDSADLALASAMVLVGVGETPYAELLAYHLMDGYGTPKRPDRGLEWLSVAIESLRDGATPLVATGGDDRTVLLETAALTLSGGAPGVEVLRDVAATPDADAFVLPGATEAPAN